MGDFLSKYVWLDVSGHFTLQAVALLVSALVFTVFLELWNSRFLLGRFYKKESLTDDILEEKTVLRYVLDFVWKFLCSLGIVFILTLITQFNADMIGTLKGKELKEAGLSVGGVILIGGMILTFILWLGFVFLPGLIKVVNGNERFRNFFVASLGTLLGLLLTTYIWLFFAKTVMAS